MRTSTAPAATFWPRSTGNLADPSIDPRCDVVPCCIHFALHQHGSPVPDNQIDRPATVATTTPTMIEGTRLEAGTGSLGACFGASFGGSGTA